MTPSHKNQVKATKLEIAIIYLAYMMEDPMHFDYRIKNKVMEILGVEELPTKTKKR